MSNGNDSLIGVALLAFSRFGGCIFVENSGGEALVSLLHNNTRGMRRIRNNYLL